MHSRKDAHEAMCRNSIHLKWNKYKSLNKKIRKAVSKSNEREG